jgi:hypothetical protein
MQEDVYTTLLDSLINNCKEELPDFTQSNTVICFSDYSGDNEKHNVYSFLFLDLDQAIETHKTIRELRQSEPEWHSKSWIEYKKLNRDNVRRRILPKFLELANQLHGALFVFSIHEKSDNMIIDNGSSELLGILVDGGYPNWKPHIARKLMEVVAVKSYFAQRLLSMRNRYIWVSDRDAINDEGNERFVFVGKLLENFIDILGVQCKDAAIATNQVNDDQSGFYGDMLAITDLVSGAATELLDQPIGDDKMKVSTVQTLQWFDESSPSLTKLHFNVSPEGDKNSISIIRVDKK